MSRSLILSTLGVVAFGSIAAAQNSDLLALQANMALNLERSEVVQLDITEYPGQALMVDVEIAGLPLTLDLAPHSLRGADFHLVEDAGPAGYIEHDPGPVRTVRGSVLEDPGSLVAGGFTDEGLTATIRLSGGDIYWMQPLVGKVANATSQDYVVYHTDDVNDVHGACGADDLPGNTQDLADIGPPTNGTGGGIYIAELGADADFQYYNANGSDVTNTMNAIENVINTMNAQYENEVGITHMFTTIIVRTTAGGGGYTSNDPGQLLNQFKARWTGAESGIKRDVAELFTGKNMQGSVIGIAWLGVICNFNFQYSVVQSTLSASCNTDLSAHELGHNWNAGHCSCSGWTMNPSLTCANRFTAGSINTIVAHRNSRNCLDQVTGTIIYVDDFESGDYAAGGWTISGSGGAKIGSGGNAYTGTFGAKLKKTISIERTGIDATGFSDLYVLFASRSRKYEAAERLQLEWYNGSSWKVNNGGGTWKNTGWQEHVTSLGNNANNNPNLGLRFSTNANAKKERSNLDDVCIIGN